METVLPGKYLKWTENMRREVSLSLKRIPFHQVNYRDDNLGRDRQETSIEPKATTCMEWYLDFCSFRM